MSQTISAVRTIEVKQNGIDFQASFEQFENGVLESNEKVTTFEGTKTFNLLDFCEIDLVSELDAEATAEIEVKYHYHYDAELNVITLSATLIDEEGNIIIDSMSGVPFVDENGNLDCVFDCDGDYILLSELQDAGMIANCGWFKNLCKKVSTAVKKVCNTTIGKIGAVATIAVPAIIGVVCAVAAAPVVALAGGISAWLVAAGSAIASSTLVSATVATAIVTTGAVLTACLLDDIITLTEAYVVDFAESVRKIDRTDRYLLVVMSALDQPLITHYKPVSLETAKTWFSLGGQVWTPYSNDAIALIESCGYYAGKSNGEIGLAEHNIISNGVFGYWHYHAIDKVTGKKVILPGDGKDANAVKAHSVHCFFYY